MSQSTVFISYSHNAMQVIEFLVLAHGGAVPKGTAPQTQNHISPSLINLW